jgi:glucose dehydrogenase
MKIGRDAPAPGEFSLVLGGPLYQLWRGTRLAGDALQLVRRRVVALTLLVWALLLLLSVAEGHFWGGSVTLPFLHDVELHVRL